MSDSWLAQRLASLAGEPDFDSAGARLCVQEIVLRPPADAADLLVGALHGSYGTNVAQAAWAVLGDGVAVGNGGTLDAASPLLQPFGAVCLFTREGTELLKAVVDAGPPSTIPPDLAPPDRSSYLRLLCTTAAERDHPSFDHLPGLLDLVVANAEDAPHCERALELAWEIDPHSDEWDDYCEHESPGGALVRSFLMRKAIESASAPTKDARPPAPRRGRL